MNTLNLTRFNALNQLSGNQLYSQLDAMVRLIMRATPQQIDHFEAIVDLYDGPHKQNFKITIAKRRLVLAPQMQIQSKRKALQKQSKKANQSKRSIFKLLNNFQLWQCLGFGSNQQEKKHAQEEKHASILARLDALDLLDGDSLYKQLNAIITWIVQATLEEINEFQTVLKKYQGLHKQQFEQRITTRLDQVKCLEQKKQYRDKQTQTTKHDSYIKNTNRTQRHKEVSVDMYQQEEQEPFICEHHDYVDASLKGDLVANQEKIEKDQIDIKSKLKIS